MKDFFLIYIDAEAECIVYTLLKRILDVMGIKKITFNDHYVSCASTLSYKVRIEVYFIKFID